MAINVLPLFVALFMLGSYKGIICPTTASQDAPESNFSVGPIADIPLKQPL
jgi:hypothetical protein